MHLTKRHYLMLASSAVVATVLGLAATRLPKRSDPMTVPAQTAIHVTLDQAVASNQNRPGDHFDATVSEPVVIDGKTVIPQGAHAEGLVVDAKQSGRLRGRARLQLALQTVAVNGRTMMSGPLLPEESAATTRNATWRGLAAEPVGEP